MCVLLDLLGKRFGSRTVTARAGNAPGGRALWVVQCDCGDTAVRNSTQIQRGQSCHACSHRHHLTHGHARKGRHSAEYRAWNNIKSRCLLPHNPGFRNYGGRGITICSRWLTFENFLADMGRRPSPQHSIDRIDNDGNYEPGNCRWATRKEQAQNRRTTRLVTIGGERRSISDWEASSDVSAHQIGQRLDAGLSGPDSVLTPKGQAKLKLA